jgi:hypothetical protein
VRLTLGILGRPDRRQHPDRARAWACQPGTAPRGSGAGGVFPVGHYSERATPRGALCYRRKRSRAAFVEAALERFPLLPVDLAIARAHAQLWAGLMAEGRLIGPHDLWLAATCLAHGLTMVTANMREFARVPGLVVESWASER